MYVCTRALHTELSEHATQHYSKKVQIEKQKHVKENQSMHSKTGETIMIQILEGYVSNVGVIWNSMR